MAWLADGIRAVNRLCIALVLALVYLLLFGVARMFVRTTSAGWHAPGEESPPGSAF